MDGDITLDAADTTVDVPAARRRGPPASYQLVALSILEDPAGNRIGRAFEVDMTRAAGDAASPDAYRLAVQSRRTGILMRFSLYAGQLSR